MIRNARWDGPSWALLLLGLVSAGSLACLGLAAAQTRSTAEAEILTTDHCAPPSDLL